MGGALGVVITTNVAIEGRAAVPVYVDDSLPIVGPSRAIVVMPTDGSARLAGGPPMAVRLAPAGTPAIGPALPVYVVSGSLTFSPASLPNLLAWYDARVGLWQDTAASSAVTADGQTVARWDDQSGNGLHLTQSAAGNRPSRQTVAGAIVVRNAASKFLSNAVLACSSTGLSIFAVLNPSSVAASQKILGVGGANTIIWSQANSEWSGQAFITTNDLWLTGMPLTAVFRAAGMTANASGAITFFNQGLMSFRLQGHQAYIVPVAALTGLYLGTYSGTTNHWTGDYKEVILYNRAITSGEARQVLAYLAARHNLTQTLAGRNIVWIGNSQTVGYSTFPAMTDVALPQCSSVWLSHNLGVAAQTLSQIRTNLSAQTLAYYHQDASLNVAVLWELTNELNTVQNPATVYATLQAVTASLRSFGFKVVVVTCLPRTDAGAYANFEADRQTLNTNIRNNYATFADALSDVGNDATIGGAAAPNNATYYSDKLHPTTAGYAIVATYMKNAINAL